MTLWLLWSVLFTALLGAAAVAASRAAALLGLPRRFIWVAAIVAASIVPTARLFRSSTTAGRTTAVARARAGPAPRGAVLRPTSPSLWRRTLVRAARTTAPFNPWVGRVWPFGSAIVLLLFARSAFAVRRRRLSWRDTTVDAAPVLLATDAGPAVIGFFRPRIVLPEWALSITDAQRALMLRHEVEHVRARDPLLLLVAGLLLAAFPWNAALWWMVRQLRLAIEIDCDARVIRTAGGAREYGMVLLAVGERLANPIPLAASLTEPRPFLERRIDAMTTPRPRRPLLAALPFTALALAVATAAAQTSPATAAAGAVGAVLRARTAPPLTTDQIKSVLAQRHPSVLQGDPSIDRVTIVLDADNHVVATATGKGPARWSAGGGSSTDPNLVRAMAIARAVSVGSGSNATGGAVVATDTTEMQNANGDIPPEMVQTAIGRTYAAGEVSPGKLLVVFLMLKK